MQLNGSQIIVQCLKEQGVDTVFGYPGGAILNVYDELYKHPEITHILTSHEQGASHAADGYARATGKVGVCIATSGPGATNLVTGIATAFMDSIPVVAITCNVGVSLLGKDSFQEIDIAGITMPITKRSFIVKDIKELAVTMRRAFQIARSDRPGPVLVDVTKDVTGATCEFEPEEIKEETPKISYTEEELKQVISLLKEAKKPFVLVGGGAVLSNAWQEVREFVARFNSPVCDTLMGKGVIDGNVPEYTGMIGMHGTKASDFGVSKCDCLVALGVRFSDRITGDAKRFASGAKIIQIDIDAAEINKNVRTAASLVGDLKLALKDILAVLDQQDHKEWLEGIEELKQRYPLKYEEDQLSCPYIIQEIDRITEGQALITTDVGQHQMWAAQYYTFTEPRTLLTSGGLGTMGYGLGACIGAKMARPDKICINIAGDGCFRMNLNELATASRYNIPVIEVVINNHVLGMVRQWQTLFYGKRYSQTVLQDSVDFCKIAEGMGCEAIRITTKEEVEPAIRKALSMNRPVVLDCIIPEDDKVLPMVPAGAPISESFDWDDLKAK
ncbi:MAG: biosynthetic-type acetolactate synthase large subunit, partial [Lachnospiraceae bacterium]|nr:biosynthetic-type acetolactate synthase large subunit [Lachnospiraceae bacterium]